MTPHLFDTDTLSEIIRPLDRRSATVTDHLREYLRAKQTIAFSEISIYEVLRGLRHKGSHVFEEKFRVFCEQCQPYPVSLPVLELAADLWAQGRRQGMTVGDNDLIIAATALIEQLPLVTANTRHYDWITGLPLTNWRA